MPSSPTSRVCDDVSVVTRRIGTPGAQARELRRTYRSNGRTRDRATMTPLASSRRSIVGTRSTSYFIRTDHPRSDKRRRSDGFRGSASSATTSSGHRGTAGREQRGTHRRPRRSFRARPSRAESRAFMKAKHCKAQASGKTGESVSPSSFISVAPSQTDNVAWLFQLESRESGHLAAIFSPRGHTRLAFQSVRVPAMRTRTEPASTSSRAWPWRGALPPDDAGPFGG